MSSPPRRKPSSSRTTTPRPRRLAGQTGRADLTGAGDSEREADAASGARGEGGPGAPVDGRGDSGPGGGISSASMTAVLMGWLGVVLVASLVLSGIGIVGAVWPSDETSVEVTDGQIAIAEGRPVLASDVAWDAAVGAAAEAAESIVSVNWEEYDAEIETNVELMTADFEEQYRETKQDSKQGILDGQVEVVASVAAQGVVRANRTEVQALLFLDQFVTREDPEQGTSQLLTPYKVLVTMVHTDQGWLVDDMQTDAAAEPADD